MLGNPEWLETSVFDDDYCSEEERDISPIDDDFIRDEYRDNDE